MKNSPTKKPNIYKDICIILQSARCKAHSVVNTAMVEAYWLIGKRIVEEEQHGENRAEYGKRLLENLSKNLNYEFGKGFSYANLRNFRQFYLTYPQQEIRYTVCSKLSWSHNRLIMRVKNAKARLYYLEESIAGNWSVRQLQRNINSQYYQRLLSTTENQIASPQTFTLPRKNNLNTKEFFKDPYVLEFLNIAENKLIESA